MSREVVTISTCDIPGCNVSDTIEGAFPERIPDGWMVNVGNVLVCSAHAKAIMAILAGKKVRGKDKKPRIKPSRGDQTASGTLNKESIAPPPEAPSAKKSRELNRNCVGCKEQKSCFKENIEALDCWTERSKR